jgi:GTPase Era involved in 16S rRNA processing
MPVTEKVIIKNITERYLNLEEGTEINSIAEILDFPLLSLKNATKAQVAKLKKHGVKTIGDLSNVKPAKMEKILAAANLDPGKLEKLFIACKLISGVSQKRAASNKTEMKIVVVGLDNAGKTSLIDLLAGKKLSEVIDQRPTALVKQVSMSAQQTNIVAWDFGGQVQYRKEYIQHPDRYFGGLDLVIFVIDVQDADRYEDAFGYFGQLIDIISVLGEAPYFLILLHKADPELRDDPEFQINLNFLDLKVNEIMRASEFSFEVVTSSIYSNYHSQPQLVGVLKDMFKNGQTPDPNSLMLDAMMKLTDIMVEVGNRIMESQENLRTQIASIIANTANPNITTQAGATLLAGMTASVVPIPPPPPKLGQAKILSENVREMQGDVRGAILTELREIFAMRGKAD